MIFRKPLFCILAVLFSAREKNPVMPYNLSSEQAFENLLLFFNEAERTFSQQQQTICWWYSHRLYPHPQAPRITAPTLTMRAVRIDLFRITPTSLIREFRTSSMLAEHVAFIDAALDCSARQQEMFFNRFLRHFCCATRFRCQNTQNTVGSHGQKGRVGRNDPSSVK
ncbi:hypothetical protein KCP73_00375 [Salmonella enterica subsp. enterica]|nr:hypothetical protein KCP73_00375 [Salmonella enterica subsp. enterica]